LYNPKGLQVCASGSRQHCRRGNNARLQKGRFDSAEWRQQCHESARLLGRPVEWTPWAVPAGRGSCRQPQRVARFEQGRREGL